MARGKTATKATGVAQASSPAPRVQLKEPVEAGTLTVAEAEAIKERKRIAESYEAQYKAKQEELTELAKTRQLLANEANAFLMNLVRDRGLDMADAYDVRSETGVIWRVTGPAPEARADTAPIEPSPETPANGQHEPVEA